jgi:hypothetical protein
MSLTQEEVHSIARDVTKAEKKWLAPSLLLTFLITIAGWAYSAGVVSTQVSANSEELKARRDNINAVPELQHDVTEVKRDLKHVEETVVDIKTEQAIHKEILQRIENKLDR